MNSFIKPSLAAAALIMSVSNVYAITDTDKVLAKDTVDQSVINNSVSRKYSPEVTLDVVQEIFGHNLDTNDATLQTLLLAIGMDHTTNESPNIKSSIGIPFIVDREPVYWVKRLNSGDHETEVLVNNALLLLFAKHEIPNSEEVAFKLMEAAANNGYWPASFYVAEHHLKKYLSAVENSESSSLTDEMKVKTFNTLGKDAMTRYNECAKIGFAPCQFRVGFWLITDKKTLKDGIEILRLAINTTMKDSRYRGVLDDAIILAAKEVVFNGEEAGLDYVVREEYSKLIQIQLSAHSQEIEEAKAGQQSDLIQ